MKLLDIIQPHPTWDTLDSTKLICYKECPRKFFYRYILGWHTNSVNNHLVFGSAWHIAMEHLLLHGPASFLDASIAFTAHYREHFPLHTDELYSPKTVENASDSIRDYARKYHRMLEEHTVLYTELGGLVLVSDDRTMSFKCDAILQDGNGRIFGLDYKTSQRRYSDWGDHWVLSTQMLTYLHALHCLFPDQNELEMLVRCAFFYKKDPTIFEDQPVRKSLEQMDAWLEDTNVWIDAMDYDRLRLLSADNTERPTMSSFPKNDTACFNYGRKCEFFDYCNAWANPLTRCDEPPIGMHIEWWDPLDRPEIRTKVNLATQSGTPVPMED